jgi:anti-sigma factor RsiW
MSTDSRSDPEMACRDLVEVVTAYLEDALGDADRRRFEAHLGECEECVAYVEQIRATIAGAERSAAQVPPLDPDLREGVRNAFRSWVA